MGTTTTVTAVPFTVHSGTSVTTENLSLTQVVIAGWTGRDPVARDRHIAELEALGVKRPAAMPIYYRAAANRVTTGHRIEVSGEQSSGEVEFVLVSAGSRLLVGVGSDHTDRRVETYNVTVSKQMCDKPLAPALWEHSDVKPHWDRLILRSWAWVDDQRTLYQEGPVSTMLPPEDLIHGFTKGVGLPAGTAMFCGTLPAHAGIRPSPRFEYEIEDPVLGRRIGHAYDVIHLPIDW